jgi:hypothetical protein
MRKMKFVGTRILMFALVGGTVMGFGLSALWNALMPAIFGLPAIGFWQALGLFLLSRILFGNFGGRRRRPRFVNGWKDLSPEERERFRNAMGARDCGPSGAAPIT